MSRYTIVKNAVRAAALKGQPQSMSEGLSVSDTPTNPFPAVLQNVPVLPLRDVVVYPHMVIPLFVGREKSILALDLAMKADKRILLVAQKQADVDDPKAEDLYRVGTVATILQLLKLPDGTVKVLVEGVDRARIEKLNAGEYFSCRGHAAAGRRALRRARDGRADALGDHAVRAVRQAQQEGAAGDPDLARRHRAGRPPGRHRRRAHVAEARREAEGAGDPGRAQAPRAHAGRHRGRDGRAADREAHPRPRQAADGEEPARVLPERADEGHPEGTGRAGRGAATKSASWSRRSHQGAACPRRRARRPLPNSTS